MKKSRFSEEQMVKILREADKSPVSRVAKKHGVSEQTIYAWRKRFGTLEAVDAKRFGRIGHAIHGDRRKRGRGAGWEVVFVCIDDHSRLAYAEVHPAENAVCATRFFRRALRWFENLGIRCERLLTDNAKCYGSNAFMAWCDEKDVSQRFTRPLHAPDQRKGRAVHPDPQAPLGLSLQLQDLGHQGGVATTLGQARQSPATPPSDRQDAAHGSAQSIPSMLC